MLFEEGGGEEVVLTSIYGDERSRNYAKIPFMGVSFRTGVWNRVGGYEGNKHKNA